jgi:hypothetical protein
MQVLSPVLRSLPTAMAVSRPGDGDEQEADRVAEQVMRAPTPRGFEGADGFSLSHIPPRIQRAPADGAATTSAPAAQATVGAPPTAEPAAAALIVEDEARELGPGQMRKSAFLDALQSAVCAAADAELAAVGQSSEGCPYVEKWLGYYRGRDSRQVEGALRKYAPEARGATAAQDYIPAVSQRVRRAVTEWATTGQITGVPEELASQILEAELLGTIGSMASGLTDAVTSGVSAVGGLLFKARDGGARNADPQAVQSQLMAGRPLDSGVKGRMESAFGHDFSRVRVHTDAKATALSSDLQARAFTIGRDIAFGPGEYQPGTVIGEALLAHELAHVVQQGGAAALAQPGVSGMTPHTAMEEEADQSAVSAVVSLWGGGKARLARLAKNAMPRLKSGLKLQRCKSERTKEIERLGGVQHGFLEEKRKKKEEEERRKAEEAAKKRGEVNPKIEVEVTMDDVLQEEVKKSGFTKHPTDPWDKDISEADRQDYIKKRAPEAWKKVLESVKGTELEGVMKGKTYRFEPRGNLEKGYYAYQDGNAYVFGMSWVHNVEADPKNVWPNLAHEMGGHFEYGTTYASEIMNAAIELMPEADQKKWKTDPEKRREFYLTYEYPETEIFAALRELRYADPPEGTKPTYGGLHPYQNIPDKLNVMKNALAPEVAKAVLQELKRRVDASSTILERDKKYFVEEVKKVFGYTL